MKHDVFLNGKTVDLVVLELKHVKKTDWYKWLNNQKLTTYTKQGYFPNTKEKQLKYFLDNLHKKKELNKKFSEDKKLQLGIINKTLHQVDEYVKISDLNNLQKLYFSILEKYSSSFFFNFLITFTF